MNFICIFCFQDAEPDINIFSAVTLSLDYLPSPDDEQPGLSCSR